MNSQSLLVVRVYSKEDYNQLLKLLRDNHYFCLNNERFLEWSNYDINSCFVINNKEKKYYCSEYEIVKHNTEMLKRIIHYNLIEVTKFINNNIIENKIEDKTENNETNSNCEIIIL